MAGRPGKPRVPRSSWHSTLRAGGQPAATTFSRARHRSRTLAMIWCPARPDAVRIDSGWNCTAQRAAAGSSIAITTPSAPSGEQSAAVTSNPPRTSPAGAYRLWYRPAVNSAGSPASSAPSGHPDQARLAVRGLRQQGQGAAGVLHHGLQAQADAEHRQVPRVDLVEQRRAAEVGRPPGTGRHDYQVRRIGVEQRGREPGPQRGHLGALLPEVVAERVHERVLVIDEQDPLGIVSGRRNARRPRPGGRRGRSLPGWPRSASRSARAP